MNDIGRPEYTDSQYETWLNEMSPFLKIGNSLYFAMDKALLLRHKTAIYEKYRLKDWFSEKIDAYQQFPGEIVNSIFNRLVLIVDEKIKRGELVNNEEWRNLRFFAEKHRSCQPFFVNRQEMTQTNQEDIGTILDNLEKTDYAELGRKASETIQTFTTHS